MIPVGAACASVVHNAPGGRRHRPTGSGSIRDRQQGMNMSDITIFHNPDCTTSRNTLALLRHAGLQPRVIEYLKTPPSREEVRRLLAEMGLSVRQLLREKGTPYAELGLADPKWSDGDLLDFMQRHPILMNRPIVRTPLGTRLCRPSEEVLAILPVAQVAPFSKEDGEMIQDTGGRVAPQRPGKA
jgi:arsenate reductase